MNSDVAAVPEPLVSVVVPVFKVEESIERCAVSLFSQTLEDVEFIFVDDGTPDRSISVLQSVIDRFPDRKALILHNPRNMGLPETRCKGLAAATGKYVINMDSDDFPEPDMLEKLHSAAAAANADIAICGWYEENPGSCLVRSIGGYPEDKDALLSGLVSGSVPSYLWSMLIRRNVILKDLMMPAANMGDDLVLTVQAVNRASGMTLVDEPLYHYCYNPESLVRAVGESEALEKYRQHRANLDLVISYLVSEGLDGRHSRDILMAKYNARRWIRHLTGQRKYYRMWKGTYPEVDRLFLRTRGISVKTKISYLLALTRLELVWRPVYCFFKKR